MNNNSDNTSGLELNNRAKDNRNKTLLYGFGLLISLLVLVIGYLLLRASSNNEVTKEEQYRFVNNNSVLCTHNISRNQIDCTDLDNNQTKSTKIPSEYKNLASIQPSYDGTRFLLSYAPDLEDTKYVVTNTDFSNPTDVEVPYEDADATNITPEIIWGNSQNYLLISRQVREEGDADFLPAPLVVWNYDIKTKEVKRIFKNGENEEPNIKVVGASEEYLFILQPVFKNWVANDVDPPADNLLAVRLDDGFVRVVVLEKLVKFSDRNKYATGIYIKYDPVVSTFYVNGQLQSSDNDYQNFYVAAKLVENDSLKLEELARLTSQAQYLGITTTSGTLIGDWSDMRGGFIYSLASSSEVTHELENIVSEKDYSKFVIDSLPKTE